MGSDPMKKIQTCQKNDSYILCSFTEYLFIAHLACAQDCQVIRIISREQNGQVSANVAEPVQQTDNKRSALIRG